MIGKVFLTKWGTKYSWILLTDDEENLVND